MQGLYDSELILPLADTSNGKKNHRSRTIAADMAAETVAK
jgi:hypothetical protein